MIQILQSFQSGEISLADVPCPTVTNGHLLIHTKYSLISSGTERMLMDFGKANYLEKALQQPDKVKQALSKVKTDGIVQTINAIRSKLDQPVTLGYCNAGVVLESMVNGIKPGDRVVSNGAHAEVVRIPGNLCVKIPDEVDDESAAFTVLGAIGLQGIRLAAPTLGEFFVVSGLGLVGLMTVQMLIANGCRVLGIDFDSARCDLARQFGADAVDLSKGEDPLSIANAFSLGRGVDGVIITAATKSDEVIHQAAQMCRKRGRIILVGVIGLNLRRDDFFKKELTFQVSASYGPGRYDSNYEEKGQDYPIGFVRWTEQRNFEAVLEMIAKGTLNVKPLISNVFDIKEAFEAYKFLEQANPLGILLRYPHENDGGVKNRKVYISDANYLSTAKTSFDEFEPIVGFVGAGNYASRTLIPAFKFAGARLDTVFSSGGVSGLHHGKKNKFYAASTDLDLLWNSKEINTAVIATRHNLHATQVIQALRSRKKIFVEKPLALTLNELEVIQNLYSSIREEDGSAPSLMIGFNRRFSPLSLKMKSLLTAVHDPKIFIMTINAGQIPQDHWTHDKEIGGGRLIGEGCHFIDLMRFFVGYPICDFNVISTAKALEGGLEDKISFNLSFEDGSFGTIHYLANGGKSFPKERIEVFCGGGVLQLDNFRRLIGFDWKNFRRMSLWQQDKGQNGCVKAFIEALRQGKSPPIPIEEIFEVSRVAIQVAEAIR